MVKGINDYVESVHEKFPELSKLDIKRILVYGWRMIIQYVSRGNDFSINNCDLFMFIGEIPVTPLPTFKKYKYKLAKRIRFMFERTKSKWDGYYYFALSENQYIDYLKQNKKKYKVFKNVSLYKLLEEAKIAESNYPYIFRLKEDKTGWMNKFYKEIKTENAELIIVRDPLKMQDILTSHNKFKYIQH